MREHNLLQWVKGFLWVFLGGSWFGLESTNVVLAASWSLSWALTCILLTMAFANNLMWPQEKVP